MEDKGLENNNRYHAKEAWQQPSSEDLQLPVL